MSQEAQSNEKISVLTMKHLDGSQQCKMGFITKLKQRTTEGYITLVHLCGILPGAHPKMFTLSSSSTSSSLWMHGWNVPSQLMWHLACLDVLCNFSDN